MKNGGGLIIIICVLLFAAMRAFGIGIEVFNIKNIGTMTPFAIGLVVAVLAFFGMQSKKSSSPDYYKPPENDDPYANSNKYTDNNPYANQYDNQAGSGNNYADYAPPTPPPAYNPPEDNYYN